jgi:hypothetical protein
MAEGAFVPARVILRGFQGNAWDAIPVIRFSDTAFAHSSPCCSIGCTLLGFRLVRLCSINEIRSDQRVDAGR